MYISNLTAESIFPLKPPAEVTAVGDARSKEEPLSAASGLSSGFCIKLSSGPK
jgi:hypothetical protein